MEQTLAHVGRLPGRLFRPAPGGEAAARPGHTIPCLQKDVYVRSDAGGGGALASAR